MKVMFLDESGDHNLAVIDQQYPLFVLGGVIVDKAHAEGELTREMDAFKRELFGRTNFVLHTADLVLSPIGRYLLGKPDREDFRIVESKFRRNRKGECLGYGLVILPKGTGPAPTTQSPAHK